MIITISQQVVGVGLILLGVVSFILLHRKMLFDFFAKVFRTIKGRPTLFGSAVAGSVVLAGLLIFAEMPVGVAVCVSAFILVMGTFFALLDSWE